MALVQSVRTTRGRVAPARLRRARPLPAGEQRGASGLRDRGGNSALSQAAGAAASKRGRFQPLTLTTGVDPRSKDVAYVAVRVSDSPGHSVMSLSLHVTGSTWLSPASSMASLDPRRTSVRTKKATVRVG